MIFLIIFPHIHTNYHFLELSDHDLTTHPDTQLFHYVFLQKKKRCTSKSIVYNIIIVIIVISTLS